MKYLVAVREVWIQDYEVEASSPQEALNKAMSGLGEALDNELEYSHTPDSMNFAEYANLIHEEK